MKYIIPFLILGMGASLHQSTGCRVDEPEECTGEHEVYTECGNDSCVRDCRTFGLTNIACRPSCNPGCICERGYIRNAAGVCVHPLQCENNVCPAKNEVFSECVSPCGETCQNLGQNLICNFLACNQGCDCKPGFFRNGDGSCVPPEECDCGGEGSNQELDLCHNPCPPEGCEDIGKMFKCGVPEVCKPACRCKRNYKRDSFGVCVDIRDCPQLLKCKENEVYDACPGYCIDERCIKEPQLACSADSIEFLTCRPKCLCQEGYCRNEKRQCVEKRVYESCGGDPNAYLDTCGSPCQLTCENKHNPPMCAAVCLPNSTPVCKCKSGFVKDYTGKCILPEDCPKCGENEVFKCGSDCGTKCNTLGDICPIVDEKCTFKCFCKDGYTRNSRNLCIPYSECVQSCGGDPNAYTDPCGDICPTTCENKDDTKRVCIAVACLHEPDCRCRPGYVRDFSGKCILPEDCPKCGVNEIFKCGPACDTTCATLGEVCPIVNKKCTLKCYCKDGFARNDKDVCIPVKKCPPCKGDANADPTRGCKCKEGFMKTKQDKCVPIIKCPDPNSELIACPSPCPGGTCDNPALNYNCRIMCPDVGCQCKKGFVKKSDTDPTCIALTDCPKKPEPCNGDVNADPACGCKCKEGFIKNISDKCVPIIKCPDPNSELVVCPTPCGGGTCDNPPLNYNCRKKCPDVGCQCKKGFVKKSTTDPTCIPLNKCPKKPEPCNGDVNADPTCGCKCKEGFIKNKSDKCVPIIKCPDPNSELVVDPTPCGGTCDNPPLDYNCKSMRPDVGCQCKKGFVKKSATDPTCIPLNKCPKKPEPCNGDVNADPACGCKCKEGFIKNKSDKCVPIIKCPDPNSELVVCPTPCGGGTCDNPPLNYNCKMMCPDVGCQCKKGFVKKSATDPTCIPLNKCPKKLEPCNGEVNADPACGCKCKEGFIKNKSDKCVPIIKCPDPNSELVVCPTPCGGGTCDNPPLSYNCKMMCPDVGCQCKKGFVKRSSTDPTCIPLNKCPKKPEPCNGDVNADPACGCKCKEGFIKNKSDKCVPIIKCPDPNSELVVCPTPCGGGTCDNPPLNYNCRMKCPDVGCQCKKGFVKRSATDPTCIPLNKCPKKPEPCNEGVKAVASSSSSSSSYAGINPSTGEAVAFASSDSSSFAGFTNDDADTIPCKGDVNADPTCGCKCKEGFIKKKSDKCVPIIRCTDPNSELVSCPNPCPGGTCDSPTFSPCKRMCPEQGCQCKKGFVKKSATDPTCIALNKCPKKPKC